MTKTEALKRLLSKMTGRDVSAIDGDTVGDLLDQIVEAYEHVENPGNVQTGCDDDCARPKALNVIFARKSVGNDGKFIIADRETIDFDLILDDGTIIPANITFTDVDAST